VVSNDSDIAEAMQLFRHHHGKLIGLITPKMAKSSRQLKAHADFLRRIRPNALQSSQLPNLIVGTTITKPARW
jgi:hypothetical protein